MESSSAPSKIQISETTKALLPKTYIVEFRGELAVKGKGQVSGMELDVAFKPLKLFFLGD